MVKTLKRLLLYGILTFVVLFTGSTVLLHHLIELDKVKPQMEKAFSEFLRRDLTIERLGWQFFPMPALVGFNVRLWEEETIWMAESPRVTINISPMSIIKRKLTFGALTFDSPKGSLRRKADGSFPLVQMIADIRARLNDIREEKGLRKPKYEFKEFNIVDGVISLFDESIKPERFKTKLHVNALGEIQGVPGARTFPFWLESRLTQLNEEGQFRIEGVLKKYSKVKITSDGLPVAAFGEMAPILDSWSGKISVDLDLERTLEGLQWKAKGRSTNLKPTIKGTFPKMDLSYKTQNGTTSYLQAQVSGKNTQAKLDLSFPDITQTRMKGRLTSPYCDIEELLKWRKSFRSLIYKKESTEKDKESTENPMDKMDPYQNPWEVDLDVLISSSQFRQAKFESFGLTLHRSSTGSIRLDPIIARGLGGKLEAKAVIDYDNKTHTHVEISTSHRAPHFKVSWKLENMDVGPLVSSLASKRIISGIGKSNGAIEGCLGFVGWEQSDGMMAFQLNNGVLLGTPGIIKAFSRLNVRTLLKKSNGDDEGFPYKVARLEIKLKDGKAQLEPPGVFESDTLHVGFMGAVNLVEKKVDGKIIFQFLTVVGEVVKAVPGIKQILYGDQKGLVPIWMSVKGPLNDPKIRLLPLRSITNSLWKGIGRVLRFPFRPFEKKK